MITLIGAILVRETLNQMRVTVEEYSQLAIKEGQTFSIRWQWHNSENCDTDMAIMELKNNFELQNRRQNFHTGTLYHLFKERNTRFNGLEIFLDQFPDSNSNFTCTNQVLA